MLILHLVVKNAKDPLDVVFAFFKKQNFFVTFLSAISK